MPKENLKTRVVLISGSSGGGLSNSITKALLSNEKYIVYSLVRNIEKAQNIYKNENRQPIFVKHNLKDKYTEVEKLVHTIMSKHGSIDILINSAGTGRNWPLECESEDTIQETFDINTLGPIKLCKAVLPGMKNNKSGQIINITSIGGLVPDEMTEIYNATKYALTGFSESLQLTCRHFGIKVTVVTPGPMDTPSLWSSLIKDYPKEACDIKTQELIDNKFDVMSSSNLKFVKPDFAANLIMENVINNPKPDLFYVMNFGYCKDKLDSKYKDLKSYSLPFSDRRHALLWGEAALAALATPAVGTAPFSRI